MASDYRDPRNMRDERMRDAIERSIGVARLVGAMALVAAAALLAALAALVTWWWGL